jgi:hypothetical protein
MPVPLVPPIFSPPSTTLGQSKRSIPPSGIPGSPFRPLFTRVLVGAFPEDRRSAEELRHARYQSKVTSVASFGEARSRERYPNEQATIGKKFTQGATHESKPPWRRWPRGWPAGLSRAARRYGWWAGCWGALFWPACQGWPWPRGPPRTSAQTLLRPVVRVAIASVAPQRPSGASASCSPQEDAVVGGATGSLRDAKSSARKTDLAD